ncbi:hypothetical protein F-M6_0350 [Faustovirus]|nr:hypothetical protein F-M6_0350 [Faustovirus]
MNTRDSEFYNLLTSINADFEEIFAPNTPNTTPESQTSDDTDSGTDSEDSVVSDNESETSNSSSESSESNFDITKLKQHISRWKELIGTGTSDSEININANNSHKLRVVGQLLRHFDSNWLNVAAANTSGFVYLLDNDIVDETIDIYNSSNIGDCIIWFIAHIAGRTIDDYAKYCRFIQYLIEIAALFNQTNVIKTILSAVSIKHPDVVKKIGLFYYMPSFSLRTAINNAVLNHNSDLAEWLTLIAPEAEKDISNDTVNLSCLNKSLFSEMSTSDINYRDYIKSNGYYYAIISNDIQLLDTVSDSIYTTVKKCSLSTFIQIMEAMNITNNGVDGINLEEANMNSIPSGYSINFPLAYAIAYKYADDDVKGYVLRDANYASMTPDETVMFRCNVYKHLLTSLHDIDMGISYLESIPNIDSNYSSAYINTLSSIDRLRRYDLLERVRALFSETPLDLLVCISLLLTNKRPVIEFLCSMQDLRLPRVIRKLGEFAVDDYGRELFASADGDDISGAREYADLFARGYRLSVNNFIGEDLDETVAKIISVEMITSKTYDEFVTFIESRGINISKVHYTTAVYFARVDVLEYLFDKARDKAPMYLPLMVNISDDLPREQRIKNKQVLQLLAYHGVPIVPRDADTNLHKAFIY